VRRGIDKRSAVPYYDQLRELLEQDIRHGRLAEGAQLPSEAQLCDAYAVSRTVVRQALNELAGQGLIRRHKGKGSFVAPPKVDEHLVQSLTGLAEEVGARGGTLTNRVLALEEAEPSAAVARVLRLAPGETVVHLERLRSVDGEPWVLTSTYLPHALCAPLLALDMEHRSLYATLEEELGLELQGGRRTIEATLATERQAELLGVRPGAPVLLLGSVAWLADGTPVETFRACHRGDRSRFDVLLTRERRAPTAARRADDGAAEAELAALVGLVDVPARPRLDAGHLR
jgi:GntR family transcriptional regulator